MTVKFDLGIFARPNFQLRSLPINFRWEVTRRHPVYQAFWRSFEFEIGVSNETHEVWLSNQTRQEFNQWIGQLSDFLLSAIGIAAERPNPAIEFEQLEGGCLKAAWLSGAVHPLTNRQLASLLMAALPKEALGYVGQGMLEAAHGKPIDDEPRRNLELRKLKDLDLDGLDSFIDEPFVSINPAASARDINACLNELLVEWKNERGLTEQRTPVSKLAKYLEVWDAREGWLHGHYDRSLEKTFRALARESKVSINTLHNNYESAFKLIIGHEYSVENWVEMFGCLKLSEVFGSLGRAAKLRPLIARTKRDVPNSVISSSEHPAFIEQNCDSSESSSLQLLEDIKNLILLKKTDEEISTELELQHPEFLDQIRARMADGIL